MFKWKTIEKQVVRRKKKPGEESKLVITVANWMTEAVWWLSPLDLFAFLWGWLPALIESLVTTISDDDWWKIVRPVILHMIKEKVDGLLEKARDDSDDDD